MTEFIVVSASLVVPFVAKSFENTDEVRKFKFASLTAGFSIAKDVDKKAFYNNNKSCMITHAELTFTV